MKKTISALLFAGILSLSMAVPAFAGSWQQDASTGNWKYQNDNGSYATGLWQWIDGNGDGIAESYCFDDQGFLLVNTTTPDGYTVDANGAWIVNGVIQTKAVVYVPVQPQVPAQTQAAAQVQTQVPASSGSHHSSHHGIYHEHYEGCTIVVNTNTKKYHIPSCSSVPDIKAENLGYCSDADLLLSQGYVPCKRCH